MSIFLGRLKIIVAASLLSDSVVNGMYVVTLYEVVGGMSNQSASQPCVASSAQGLQIDNADCSTGDELIDSDDDK